MQCQKSFIYILDTVNKVPNTLCMLSSVPIECGRAVELLALLECIITREAEAEDNQAAKCGAKEKLIEGEALAGVSWLPMQTPLR